MRHDMTGNGHDSAEVSATSRALDMLRLVAFGATNDVSDGTTKRMKHELDDELDHDTQSRRLFGDSESRLCQPRDLLAEPDDQVDVQHTRHTLVEGISQHQAWRKTRLEARCWNQEGKPNCRKTKIWSGQKNWHEDWEKKNVIHQGTDGNGRTVWHGLGVSDDSSFSFPLGWAGANDNPDAKDANTPRIPTPPVANTCRYPPA